VAAGLAGLAAAQLHLLGGAACVQAKTPREAAGALHGYRAAPRGPTTGSGAIIIIISRFMLFLTNGICWDK
jgi:hypothetical protein